MSRKLEFEDECAIKGCTSHTVRGNVSHFCAKHREAGERQLKTMEAYEQRAETAAFNVAHFIREFSIRPHALDDRGNMLMPRTDWQMLAELVKIWTEASDLAMACVERSGAGPMPPAAAATVLPTAATPGEHAVLAVARGRLLWYCQTCGRCQRVAAGDTDARGKLVVPGDRTVAAHVREGDRSGPCDGTFICIAAADDCPSCKCVSVANLEYAIEVAKKAEA